eukprot:1265428-Amphidinium_carterae.1
MPQAAGAAFSMQTALVQPADANGDIPQSAGAALSASHAASAALQNNMLPSTILDETQSAGGEHTISQTASAASANGPHEAAHMRMCACPGIDILAYADDIILVLHPEIATLAWDLWKRILARHNLRVQADKTVVFHPAGAGPLDGELLAVFASQPKRTGLVLCGLPIWSKESRKGDSQAIPFGTPEFVAEYLEAHAQVMEGRLRALSSLQEALDTHNAQHVALYLLRS